MKMKTVFIGLGVTAALAVSGFIARPYIKDMWEFSVVSADLIDKALAEPVGQIVTPKTTAEMAALFDGVTTEAVPRIYVDRLPDDFAPTTVENKTLFMKVLTALALRNNERILAERHALQVLEEKRNRGHAWSQKEMRFFNLMADKYDAQLPRTMESKMANLMSKVDIIPASMVVNQAIYFTDWGAKNTDAPYGQYYWADNAHYVLQPFGSLVDATDSFMLEMNSLSSLIGFHQARATMMPIYNNRRPLGPQLTHHVTYYMPEDTQYVNKLLRTYQTGLIAPLDWAQLAPVGANEKSVVAASATTQPTALVGKAAVPVTVEIADEAAEWQRGLMFRKNLPENVGMLFIFDAVRPISMWMKNTFIPLDMLFFDDTGVIVHIAKNTVPLDKTLITSQVPVRGVLEVNAGFADKHGIQTGEKISYPSDN